MKERLQKKLKTVRKIIHIKLSILVIILLPFVVFSLLTSKTDKLFGIRSFVVLTGSMNPSIPQGSLIYTKKSQEYKKGDVIAFQQGQITITHRIVDSVKNGKKVFYSTQGDANNTVDSTQVSQEKVLGKAENRIPYIGNFILFLRTLPGFIGFIVMPVLVYIGFEFWSIKGEIEKNVERRMLQRLQI